MLLDFFTISRITYRIHRVASGFDNGFRCFDLRQCEHIANLQLLFIVSSQQTPQDKCN